VVLVSGDPNADPNEGIEPFDAAQFYGERANDVRPLQPLTFLCAAIRAELTDARRALPSYGQATETRLDRIEDLLSEIERHAEGTPK
jgi:hypothetical protein